jgi:NAD-dependent dihydropyrimidine dehydrogenase PreA subunit
MGLFIAIEVDSKNIPPLTAKAMIPICPVDIYALENKQIIVRPEMEDECTLCELCLEIAPMGMVHIRKIYKGEVLVSRG